jgi:hypothetical protein
MSKEGETMRSFYFVVACLSVLAVPAAAQSRLQSGPPPTATGPGFDVSVGYSFLTTSIPGAGRENMSGLDGAGRIDFNSRWGATVDATYVRTSDVLNTGNGGYVLTLLAGPVFTPVEHGNTRAFVHALGGVGIVDSAVPTTNINYLHGWVARYAYALGGGIEQSITNRFAFRVSGDYLRTAFVDSADVIRLQNNLRITGSFVVRLKEREPRLALH